MRGFRLAEEGRETSVLDPPAARIRWTQLTTHEKVVELWT
jgi:hypothetical protein